MTPAQKKTDRSTYSQRFGTRLRMLREQSGLRVEDVVIKVATSNSSGRNSPKLQAIYSWEQGKATPHMDLLPAIAKALKVSIRDLLPEK